MKDENFIDNQEFQTLSVLAFLYMRMGYLGQADTIFRAMLDISDNARHKRWAFRNLAYIALKQEKYTECLDFLREAIGDGTLKSRDKVLYLIKAEALWKAGREKESQNALSQYHSFSD